MCSVDNVDKNIEKIGRLFPNCLTEKINESGEVELSIDFDRLKQELSKEIVEGNEERYQFTWPDKRKAELLANSPISKTLRPSREESIDFDNTENLYIEGDNLEALKLLQETYLGKVKMIYIDPPYNTGNDFIYNDKFSKLEEEYKEISGDYDDEGNRLVQNLETNGRFHTDWLNMIYPRLKVAQNLLSDDGVIFISIDDNEVHNLRKICDELFGEKNFIAEFIWEKKKKPSFLNKNLGIKTEYVLCFSKNRLNTGALSVDLTTAGKKYPFNNSGNGLRELKFPPFSVHFNMEDQTIEPQDMSEGKIITKLLNKLTIKNGLNQNEFTLSGEWRYSQEKLNEILKNKEQIVISKIPFRPNHIKAGGDIKKIHNLLSLSNYQVGTNEDATSEQEKIFKEVLFSYAKPSSLISFFVKSLTYNSLDSIVLDFFSGSATTAHAVMQQNSEDNGNRKFIMIQLPEEIKDETINSRYKTICDIGKKRIIEAGKELKEKYPNLDTGFRVLKVDSSNMEDVYYQPKDVVKSILDMMSDNIKSDRTSEDLLFQVMLDLGVPLSSRIEKIMIDEKEIFIVENGYLIACFDKNITEEIIKEVALKKPYYFIMRDSSMANDNVATNFEQIFVTYSPDTIKKVL